jgi:hypothetical protein
MMKLADNNNNNESEMKQEIFRGFGVEIRLSSPENFLKIKETLTRIGVSSRKEKSLYQSCHILHKTDRDVEPNVSRYAILHFKELFALDGKQHVIDNDDIARRNTIVTLLEEWNLLEVIEHKKAEDPVMPIGKIKVLSHKEKPQWKLVPKYQVGNKRGNTI